MPNTTDTDCDPLPWDDCCGCCSEVVSVSITSESPDQHILQIYSPGEFSLIGEMVAELRVDKPQIRR